MKSYFNQRRDLKHSQKIMYYFTPDKLPVLTTLASEFAVFNRWFASIPGPTLCNRAFAHYGTSFGHVDMDLFYVEQAVQEHLPAAHRRDTKHTAKIYYFDTTSSTMEVVNLLQHQPQFFGTYPQFLDDCKGSCPTTLSSSRTTATTKATAARAAVDQHPDHHVQEGEHFIAAVYNAIEEPPLWEHGAADRLRRARRHLRSRRSSACPKDQFTASANATGTGMPFAFDRLGVRVPAILVSPWIRKGTLSIASSTTRRFPRP